MSLRTAFCRTARCPLSNISRPAILSAMPLRARITRRFRSTDIEDMEVPGAESAEDIPQIPQTYFNDSVLKQIRLEEPGDEPDDVVFSVTQGVRIIQLNRPKKLNSLNGSMARKIIPRLREWEKSDMANIIIIKGEGRAFCAGGDVAALALQNKTPEGQELSKNYFALEYRLDHMIATTSKPYVAFLDGITMGGGVGLSVHAPFRIATENTIFAMPETTIGFFPDVGASFFLPRMDGQMGMYLALTSEQLRGVDVFYHGVATHYLHSTSLPALQSRLAELQFPDAMGLIERNTIIANTIEEYTSTLPSSRPALPQNIRLLIDEIFSADEIEKILHSLSQQASSNPDPAVRDWASRTKATIESRSPTSVLVTLRMLRASAEWNIREAFQREMLIASRFMAHADFVEGIDAKLIRRSKDRPNWQPNTLADALQPGTIANIDHFFPAAPATLQLLRGGQGAEYLDYPHAELALPSEQEIVESLEQEEVGGEWERCLQYWMFVRDGKAGVKEKVEDVLERLLLRMEEQGEKEEVESLRGSRKGGS